MQSESAEFTVKILGHFNLSCGLPELQFCSCELNTNNPLLHGYGTVALHKPLNPVQNYWISKQSIVAFLLQVGAIWLQYSVDDVRVGFYLYRWDANSKGRIPP